MTKAAIQTAARLHFEGMWVPDEYKTTDYLFGQAERVFAFETFRRWLKNYFFCNTEEYKGLTWLNRHMFVRIPRQSGHRFRFEAGHRSDLMPATIPK